MKTVLCLLGYETLLKSHDWYYFYSPDKGIFALGECQEEELIEIAKENGKEYIKLYNKYANTYGVHTIEELY